MHKLMSHEIAAAFEPETIEAMSIALDDICCTLNLPPTAVGVRDIIARRVIQLVGSGERDPVRISGLLLEGTAPEDSSRLVGSRHLG